MVVSNRFEHEEEDNCDDNNNKPLEIQFMGLSHRDS